MDILDIKRKRIKESWVFDKKNYVTVLNIEFNIYEYNYAYLYYNKDEKLTFFCISEKPYLTKDGDYTKQLFKKITDLQIDENLMSFLKKLICDDKIKINIKKFNNDYIVDEVIPISILTNFTHRIIYNEIIHNYNNKILIEYKKFIELSKIPKITKFNTKKKIYNLIIGQKIKPIYNINNIDWKELSILIHLNSIIKFCPFYYYLIDYIIVNGVNEEFYNNINMKDIYKKKISDKAIILFTEYVGKILKDSDELDDNIVWYFSLIYAIYCLHNKTKIIHGDISNENIAIQNVISPQINKKAIWKFNINDNKFYFYNEKYTILPIILDYSKSILVDEKDKMIELLLNNIPNKTKENIDKINKMDNKELFDICKIIDYIYLAKVFNKNTEKYIEYIIDKIDGKNINIDNLLFDEFESNKIKLNGIVVLNCKYI